MLIEELEGQLSLFDQDSCSGKTYQEHYRQTRAKTSASSSKKSQGSKNRLPLYLDLRKANGQTQDVSYSMGGALLGEYSMDSIGESPTLVMMECRLNSAHRNGVGESRLSQILQQSGVQPKYYLSEKACRGILNRAEKRGKELPEILKKALMTQASRSKLGGGREIDSLGKRAGKGALIQTELSGTLGVSQDQTLIAPTIAIEGNGTRESHRGDGYVESDVSYTLNSTEQHGVAYGIDQQGGKGGANYAEDKSPSILSDSHGTPHAVAYEAPSLDTHTHTPHSLKRDSSSGKKTNRACRSGQEAEATAVEARPSLQKTVGTLCADDWRGPNSQYVGDGKLIVEDGGKNRNHRPK